MQREMENSNKLFLYVDLPRFDFPVVFAEQVSLALSRTVSILLKSSTISKLLITGSDLATTSTAYPKCDTGNDGTVAVTAEFSFVRFSFMADI